MAKVMAAGTTVNSTWRTTARGAGRSVERATSAPTTTAATTPSTREASVAAAPSATNQGGSGTTAPSENATNDDRPAAQGEPSSAGLMPSSSRAWASSAVSGSLIIASASLGAL